MRGHYEDEEICSRIPSHLIDQHLYNDYNVSTVYVQTGGTIKARKENGKYYF